MTISIVRVLVALAAVMPMPVISAGLPPWQFGMSKAKVVSFKEFGPYKYFKNGDAETFNGTFHGHKENIQFFFDKTGLRRIGVYLYEGKDVKQAIATCRRAYELLENDYGKVAMPDIKVARTSDPVNAEVLSI
jgi:hypothetical protein